MQANKPVKLFKLITGEIVIGKLDEENDFIEDPYLIFVRQIDKTGTTFDVTLTPIFAPFSKESPPISLKWVIAEVDAPEQIIEIYLQILSGLIIPAGKLNLENLKV